jgi:DNA repair exonuclease SbcCD ATPase subunit
MFALVCLFVAVQAATASKAREEKNRPVTKVINLLKDMQEQLKKEGEEDEEVYEKVACWCETNDKDKTTSIADAESHITALTASIEEGTASSSKLNTEIKNLGTEIAKNTDALDKATALRKEELAEFNAEEKDVLQSIGALKSAITVLGKHHEALLQVPPMTLLNVAVKVDRAVRVHDRSAARKMTLSPEQRKQVVAFVQAPSDFFDAEPTFKQSYAPQSGAIFGILKQMKETFETNLATSQKEEMQSQSAYDDLKAAKESEITAGTDLSDTKTQELADTDAKLASDKQDLEDTRNSLAADQKFLMNLKETCQMTDQEYEERTKTRTEEIKSVSEALAILSSDDAHDTFTSTFNFVQTGKKSARQAASEMLTKTARTYKNPRMSTLAESVKLDGFKKVIEDIDGMVKDLKAEKAADVKQKDFCVEALHKNSMGLEMKARDIEQLDGKIAELTATIETLTKEIAALQKEVAEMQVQLKRAGEDRELENDDFQKVVADQRATQQILTAALDKLKGFYEKSFVQTRAHSKAKQPAGPPPPPSFKKYEKSSGSGGVMGMIEQIVGETKTLEADAIKAETDAQKAYETFVKDTNASIEEKQREITNKTGEKAEAEVDLTAATEDRTSALNEQQQLKNEEADLHKSCDFLMENFETRQTALEQEVEGLYEAKSVLSGSKFLQVNRGF